MPSFIPKLKLFCCLFLVLVATSCVKDKGVIETQLVITKYDRKIPTDYDIVGFDTYSENNIFAIGFKYGTIALFLSSNGGASWNDITDSFHPALNQDIDAVKSVVYMDESNLAFVAGDRLYRSYDGGQSWETVSNGFQPILAFFADKSQDGNLLFVEDMNSSWYPNKVYKSAYGSHSFLIVDTIPPSEGKYSFGHLYDNYIMFLDYENDYYYNCVHGFDLLTGEYHTIPISSTAYEYPLDAMRVGDRIFLIRKDGKLNFQSQTNAFADYSFYNFHSQDYYSGEFMGSYYIAVGDRTISTNINGDWEEALNPDISGQQEVFRKVKRIEGDYFYVSGNKGLFFKGTFK